MISQVFIVPGMGFSDENGSYDPGRAHRNIMEVDLIDEVTASLESELELENIRYQTLNTRKKPGFKLDERHKEVPPSSLVIHIRGGFYDNGKNPAWFNGSAIFYGRSEDLKLAQVIADTMGDWGQCAVYGHKKSKPKLDQDDHLIAAKLSMPVFRIEPFFINGPNVDDYWKRISLLGRDLGLCLSGWLKERGFAADRHVKFTGPKKAAKT